MASPIEEKFVKDHLIGNTVFEFGCGNGKLATELSGQGYRVWAVDLYDPEIIGSYQFIKCDFSEAPNLEIKFDNAIAVSSIEHCGVETLSFQSKTDILSHLKIAQNMVKILSDSGRLVVTVPFGIPGAMYYVDKDGNNGTIEKIKSPQWGYRTFNKESISDLFNELKLIKCQAFMRDMNKDHFSIDSWDEEDIRCFDEYDNKNLAVMCCIFTKGDI